MREQDKQFIELSIAEAKKCKPEDSMIHPRVGVVVAIDGKLIASAYRGEYADGDHAEYTLLEKKLKYELLSGCTVYTTLEPCSSRNHPKLPCVQRLIERKVSKVFIGMLDPNPAISGRGQRSLRKANIVTEFYPEKYMAMLEDLNREFSRFQSDVGIIEKIDSSLIERIKGRSLDTWYESLNKIYWNRNYQRDASSIFAHLVEVIGGLSLLASGKEKEGVNPDAYVPKAIAWWFALCGKLGIKSAEDMIWDKFPGVCAYCQKCPHDPEECSDKKRKHSGPPWGLLNEIGKERARPQSIVEWQVMFSKIYPAQQTEDFGSTFARLSEELGELAEAVRIFPSEPSYFLSEACDVFAWLMHIQNIVEQKKRIPKSDRGKALENNFCKTYPDLCLDCRKLRCSCPPILSSTIGRIAHEVPVGKGTYEDIGRFMTPDKASKRFS